MLLFSSITNNFPEMSDEWLAYGELDPLPSITEESVCNEMKESQCWENSWPI